MRLRYLASSSLRLVALCAAMLCTTAASAERFPPGAGLADPAMGINASGYVKWGQSSIAPFIDRMKGAFSWSGRLPSTGKGKGALHVLSDPDIFAGKTPAPQVTFQPDTLIDINRLLVTAVFHKKLITREQNQKINQSPDLFFKLEPGPDGRSQLLGRLRETDPYAVLVQFDRDIGMNLDHLRNKGHLKLTRHDMNRPFGELALDKNGWPTQMPADLAGRKGQITTIIMWYPRDTAKDANSMYSGTFHLLADGKGTISLTQKGANAGRTELKSVPIDGPASLTFQYRPNGHPLSLTLHDTDPDGNGNYLRNIRIVHESHLALFQAGEMFTPEFVEFMGDFRTIRWMNAMEGHRNPPFFAKSFDDRTKLDFYSFNLGTNKTERNGIPIDAIIAFSNKTGTDPWITVPVNVSDTFARGMADYIAANLDPDLTLYMELGNENWNGIFPSYRYSARAALQRWGELQLEPRQGKLPVVTKSGRFVSDKTLKKSGFSDPAALAKALGLPHPLLPVTRGWAEWSGMRAAQVGRIFEDAFAAADPATAKARLNNVLGTFSVWAGSTDLLMKTTVWRQEEPGSWIDPASVFESLAVGAYFGGTMGSRNSDLVTHWIETMGEDRAKFMALRHLTAGIDPAQPYFRIGPGTIGAGKKSVRQSSPKTAPYSADLIIDVSPLVENLYPAIHQQIRKGAGVKRKKAVMTAEEATRYLRIRKDGANTELQVRLPNGSNAYQTVFQFQGQVDKTLEQLIADGTVFPRSLHNMEAEASRYFANQAAKARAYNLDLLAYEGGQHLAAAIWGLYRANLKNAPLIGLLRKMNHSPEIQDLYRYWFDAWRKAGGGIFAHYADIGYPSRYGNWGVISHLGQDKIAGAKTYKLEVLREENSRGAWWKSERASSAFLQGVTLTAPAGGGDLTGTAKPDILLGAGSKDQISGGPGDDALFGGPGANTMSGGAGNDIIVLSSTAEAIDGGPGQDTLKAAMTLAALDLAKINAVGIEVVDTRNASRTAVSITPADVLRLTGGSRLSLLAETADTLTLPGFTKSSAENGPEGYTVIYAGNAGGSSVTLSVTTDIPPPR